MSKQPHVWVVEEKLDREWFPRADAAVIKENGKRKLLVWECCNEGCEFRVAKYVRVEPKTKKGRKP